MGVNHGHGHSADLTVRPGVARAVWTITGAFVALVVLGLAGLWPSADLPVLDRGALYSGVVRSVEACAVASDLDSDLDPETAAAAESQGDNLDCRQAQIELTDGADAGATFQVQLGGGPGGGSLEVGDRVLVGQSEDIDGETAFTLATIDRERPLWILAGLVSLAVVALARWKGLAALVGLTASLVILAKWVLPAIISGHDPVAVAATGAAAIAVVSMGLAHGFQIRTALALLGTILALVLTTFLGWWFTQALSLTGLVDEEARYLSQVAVGIDMRGLVLAGLVIGAMGVLDDVTVTQVAAVWEVHAVDPNSSFRSLLGAGMRVGRDHVAAVVNTLVLAYAGAALPLFVLITMSDTPLAQTLSDEAIAVEIVRSGVGALGVIAAVPITTVLAAWALHAPRAAHSAQPGTPAPDEPAGTFRGPVGNTSI